MSQLTQDAASATAQSYMLGTYFVTFNFSASTTSTRTVTVPIQNPPEGLKLSTIAMQSFDVSYTNNDQYGFGRLQVAVSVSGSTASCTVTLRDNHTNERQWQGTVTGLVTFYGV